MTVKSRRTAVGAAVAAFALVGVTACGGNTPQVPNLPSNLPSVPGIGDPKAAFGEAHQSALGLAALGGLGAAQGVGQDVKDLAPQVQSEGQAIDQKLRGLASAVGVSLPDQVGPEAQAQLDDLKARTGEQFDQGWLQAAQAEQQKLKDQASGLLNIPGLPADQKAAAQQQIDNLDQLGQKLAAASAAAGAATPGGDQSNQAGGDGAGQGDGSGQGGAAGQGGSGSGGSGSGRLGRQGWPGGQRRHRRPGGRVRGPGAAAGVRRARPRADRRRRSVAAPLPRVSSGRRRPGTRGPAALLLVGTLSLGVGVLLGLQDGDERSLVAQDLGAVPGSPAAFTGGAPRPLAEDIPVLSGLDDLVPQAGPVAGGVAAPVTPTSPTSEPEPVLTDPTITPVAPRPSPESLPAPEPSLAPKVPWLVSPLYPLPGPPPSAGRTPVVPAQLDLPARSVTATVDAVGTDPSGGMVVPEQVRTVGWWAPGVLPGGPAGSAVIAGHVDSRTQGIGVLSVLPQLTEGEPVLVRDATGRTATFRVAARREYGKYDLPRDVFRRDGSPQLVLITCGGRFDPAARSYESNIVVFAVPA